MEMTWQQLPQEVLEEEFERLLLARGPQQSALCEALTVGADRLTDFWTREYLEEYIPGGGSKIKFVMGKLGTGKTQLLNLFAGRARSLGYEVAQFSAETVWLHDFRETYLEILRHVDLDGILADAAAKVIRDMGYDPAEIPEGLNFMGYLAEKHENDGLSRRQIREFLREMFLNNPKMDNNFAYACSLLCGGMLGSPNLDAQSRTVLLDWLYGRPQKTAVMRAVGLASYRITKFNARHMLRSLTELIRMSGRPGLLVTVDHLETITGKSGLETLHYTPARRGDAYESIRQLVDDIDTLHNVMFLFAGNRLLMDDEKVGFVSYQALWMRIQSEIVSDRFNCFADMAVLDRLYAQDLTPEDVMELSRRTAETAEKMAAILPETDPVGLWRRNGVTIPEGGFQPQAVTEDVAERLLKEASTNGCGITKRTVMVTLGTEVLEPEENPEEGGEVSADV